MEKKVFLIHTVTGLIDLFKKLCQEIIPHAKLTQIADESLIQGVLAAGGLTPAIYRRVCGHVVAAEEAGADVIQLTCSSISPCADVVQKLVSVPVLKIDEAVIEQAVKHYARIGLIATAPTTLKPSTLLLREKARVLNRPLALESVLCEGAYDAFLSGDLAGHDKIVKGFLLELMRKTDVVLLAQASMARIADSLGKTEKTVPVLSSPRPGIERLAAVLKG